MPIRLITNLKFYISTVLKSLNDYGLIFTLKKIIRMLFNYRINHIPEIDIQSNKNGVFQNLFFFLVLFFFVNLLKQQNLKKQPLISIVMPTYNSNIKWLKDAIQSVKNQIYTNWELCIADDNSSDQDLKNYLSALSKSDKRIKVIF